MALLPSEPRILLPRLDDAPGSLGRGLDSLGWVEVKPQETPPLAGEGLMAGWLGVLEAGTRENAEGFYVRRQTPP